MSAAQLLEVRALRVVYPTPRAGAAPRVALHGLDLCLAAGETLGLVGESGSGKSSALRALLGLVPASAGSALYRGLDGRQHDLLRLDARSWQPLRRELGIVTQDPASSLDPRLSAAASVAEGLLLQRLARGAALERRVLAMLEQVGLSSAEARRYPHELSGGQRQRVALARALVLEPRVLLCDEITGALDPCVQAQMLALLEQLQQQRGLACLLVTHDLALMRRQCARALVLREGRVVEQGAVDELCRNPREAYTRALLQALPASTRAALSGA